MRFIQDALEILSHLKEGGGLRSTHHAIEYGKPEPPAAEIKDTQNDIEYGKFPPNDIRYCQGVIEVGWPMGFVPELRRPRVFYRRPFFPPR
jgi:hypothetical protein